MNNIIKSLIIILILSYTSNIFSQELIITIPEQFSNSEFPLPPFPVEVINKVDEKDFDTKILNDIEVRVIPLDKIEYLYYPEFLEFKISNKLYLEHLGILETDLNNVKLTYIANFSNNNFFLKNGLGYDTDQNLVDIVLKYNEFRLPVNLTIEGSLEDRDLSLYVGDKNYFKSWGITQGFVNEVPYIETIFKDDRNIKPLISSGYKNNDLFFITGGLGWNSFRSGVSILSGDIYPYLEFKKRYNRFLYKIETSVYYEYVDYLLNISYISNNLISLGIGSTISDTYETYEPYIYLQEDFLFGIREYKFSKDDINLEFSFINDYFTSIISLNYPFDSSNISFDLLLNFKVGKL